eukprot:jgi/Mesvir1/24774/Mv22029-RA.1
MIQGSLVPDSRGKSPAQASDEAVGDGHEDAWLTQRSRAIADVISQAWFDALNEPQGHRAMRTGGAGGASANAGTRAGGAAGASGGGGCQLIGRHVHFLCLGGDSLSAVAVCSQLAKRLCCEGHLFMLAHASQPWRGAPLLSSPLTTPQVLRLGTIARLVAFVEGGWGERAQAGGWEGGGCWHGGPCSRVRKSRVRSFISYEHPTTDAPSLVPAGAGSDASPCVASYEQEQMCVLSEEMGAGGAFSIYAVWRVAGAPVDEGELRSALACVMSCQRVLRSCFTWVGGGGGGGPQQELKLAVVTPPVPADAVPLRVEWVDAVKGGGRRGGSRTRGQGRAQGPLAACITYRTDLWDKGSMTRLSGQFLCLARHAAGQPETPVGQLALMTPAESAQVLAAANLTRSLVYRPTGLTLCDMWRRQVVARRGDVALRCGGTSLTFGQLDAAASVLASALRRLGVSVEDRVAVVMERSHHLVVALLGVLITGACYVTLDAGDPPAYLTRVLAAAGPVVVVTDRATSARLQAVMRAAVDVYASGSGGVTAGSAGQFVVGGGLHGTV